MPTSDRPRRQSCDDCASRDEARKCPVTSKDLCFQCWSEVDPRHFNKRDHEVIYGETNQLAIFTYKP